MAKIRIEKVLDKLDFELSRAMEAAIKKNIPNDVQFDRSKVYRDFVNQSFLKCSSWVDIDEDYLDLDE
jgi:hypothetical protein